MKIDLSEEIRDIVSAHADPDMSTIEKIEDLRVWAEMLADKAVNEIARQLSVCGPDCTMNHIQLAGVVLRGLAARQIENEYQEAVRMFLLATGVRSQVQERKQ